jgi:hypothetical protein
MANKSVDADTDAAGTVQPMVHTGAVGEQLAGAYCQSQDCQDLFPSYLSSSL